MRPQEWARAYSNVAVRLSDSDYETVGIRKYLMGMRSWNEYMNVLGKVNSLKAKPGWFRLNVQALNRSYTGKGSPDDLAHALDCAVLGGVVPKNPASLQSYADKFLGVDCTGFTSSWLVSAGKLSAPIWHLPTMLVNQVRYPRRKTALEVSGGDLMIWAKVDAAGNATEVKSGGVGHAVIIDNSTVRGQQNQALVQSAESNGAEGPVTSSYSIEPSTPAGQWLATRMGGRGGASSVVIVKV